MGYLHGIIQLVKDNGLINGIFFIVDIMLQRFFGIPKEKIYRYNSKKMKTEYLIKYSSDMKRGFDMSEIFGMCPYFSSQNGKLFFALNEKSKVLDLGGFIGDSAIFFAKQGALVYVFEPQRKAFELILENMELNKLNNFKAYNTAVTCDGKKINFDDSEKIRDDINVANIKKGSVKDSIKFSRTLNEEKKWDVVKIDIEGGEWKILEYLLMNKKYIDKVRGFIIELHDYSYNKELLKNFISELKIKDFNVEIQLSGRLGMLWAKKD